MTKIVRRDIYFDEPKDYTSDVIEAVMNRINETGIKDILVATTSGKTGLIFAKTFKGKANNILAISPIKIRDDIKKSIEELGTKVIDNVSPNQLLRSTASALRDSLYVFGQGLKVCVEIALIATEVGTIKPCIDVISVAGTHKGINTAIILRTSLLKNIISPDFSKRLEIKEIICMPRTKHHHDQVAGYLGGPETYSKWHKIYMEQKNSS